MIESALAYTSLKDTRDAADALGAQISAGLGQQAPDVLIIFASTRYDYTALLQRIDANCHPKLLLGCSSAGEFTTDKEGVGSISALALRSSDIKFNAVIGRDLGRDYRQAVADVAAGFVGLTELDFPWRAALILTDPLAGHGEHIVEHLTLLTAGRYQLFGGGAGDDLQFKKTHVFFGAEVVTDAFIALEILSKNPIGVGAAHGWKPNSPSMRVTAAEGMRLVSLNALSAASVYEDYAQTRPQKFDRQQPLPFFLHNIIGIKYSESDYRLRVPLTVDADLALICAAEVPEGSVVSIMHASVQSARDAASQATHAALAQLGEHKPQVALFFDCVATRLHMGDDFGLELATVRTALPDTLFAGFNTYGQVVRTNGQFNGFHNCTAVVCVLS